MKYIPILFAVIILAGAQSSCKNPIETKPGDSTKCDTCDTTKPDTTHADTTSHRFLWKEMSISSEGDLAGCCVYGTSDIYAVGNKIHHFDGSAWSQIDFYYGNQALFGLGGSAMFGLQDELWLANGGIFRCYLTTHKAELYRFEELPGVTSLHGLWGTSSNDMFAVGDSGCVVHFDGTSWMKFPKVTTKNLYRIHGTSANNIWAAGFNVNTAESVLLHFDGSAWKEEALTKIGNIGVGQHGLGGVWACDSAGHHLVYATGSLVWHHRDEEPWVSDSGKVLNQVGNNSFIGLFFLDGNGPNDILIGADGFVTHWNGRSWYRYEELYHPSETDIYAKGVSYHDRTACIVGMRHGKSYILVGQRQ